MTPHEYQLKGAAQIQEGCEGPFRGLLLGDEMGLGNTLTACLALYHVREESGMSKFSVVDASGKSFSLSAGNPITTKSEKEAKSHEAASEMCARVMSATAKQKKQNFDQAKFKREVSQYLGAAENITTDIKAAHIVPKLLNGDELSFLFGVGKLVLSDRRNGITLHTKIEQGFDSGVIAIVLIAPSNETEETKWKCLLIDQSCRDLVFTARHYWRELDGKELVFLTENRPARRYLYFRFVMSYLNCKRTGNTEWTKKVDSKTVFWASPGEYLEKSTLLSLGRNISGFELPPPLYEGNTFDAPSAPDNDYEVAMSMKLRDALRETAKQKQCDSEEDDSSEEECSDVE
ncbi:hypothetical protein FQN54_001308 [Arachnomyces sp. PD_36]|nr:hypothetical protein FQN54_001308 [Arachnomyces sp. PD_36]